ncbi:hypothetical protein F8388_024144 [Cannabis sativa]|uniref:Uncharacterized protein n=1 Tax=Cannabis sativa TaxID=3483 RepID=A0A7J6FXR1_CANSA|nr:hypothetical protein F8388_024144 [Cannabis sativa]KAF4383397.1 hypothetical protein G4B88_023971 [Cannabis sativa]
MSPVSWLKKKLIRRKLRKSRINNNTLLNQSHYVDTLSLPLVDDSDDQELDRIAVSDLRRAYWKNSEDIISDDHELESIVVHLMEKKVTVTRKSSSSGLKRKGSSRLRRSSSAVPALCRKLSHRASRVSWLSSLTCMGIYKGPILSQAKYAY